METLITMGAVNFENYCGKVAKLANQHPIFPTQEPKRLIKLGAIANKLRREENVKNRQLQTWLSNELASR